MEIYQSDVYATQPKPLQKQIETLLREAETVPVEGEILAVIVPDENLLSGGALAARVFKTLTGRHYETVVSISPSHIGTFGRMTICSVDSYRTPLGDIPIDQGIRQELCDEDDDIFMDDRGHFNPKGIDVQLPFLQTVLDGPFSLVPIVMGTDSPAFCRELGAAVGEIMYNRRTLIVSTADIIAGSPDQLERLTALFERGDVQGLMNLLNSEEVVMQGKGALLVALIASLRRNGKRFQVVGLNAPNNGTPGALGAVITR